MKAQREMLSGVKRGDRVVTGGGIIGLVTKVISDNELQVELADGVRVRIVKQTITDILTRGESVRGAKESEEDDKPMLPPPRAGGRAQEPARQPVRRQEVAEPAGRSRSGCSIFRAGRPSSSSPSRCCRDCSPCPTCCRAACSITLPHWYSQNRINLGLDLRGGAHFLLEADLRSVLTERLTNLSDSVRGDLRKQQVGVQGRHRRARPRRDRHPARRGPAGQGDRGDPRPRSVARRVGQWRHHPARLFRPGAVPPQEGSDRPVDRDPAPPRRRDRHASSRPSCARATSASCCRCRASRTRPTSSARSTRPPSSPSIW